jgi:ribosomal protein S18 acetylase RimI-like enzyme
MLVTTHQLSKTRLSNLRGLLTACQATDGAYIPLYPHLLRLYRPGPPSFLYYQNKQLIGFLALFHFYPDAAEIALLVHPNHRKQGIAKSLWEVIIKEAKLLTPPLQHLIISTPESLKQTWFKHYAFQFASTEHEMVCTDHIRNYPHPNLYAIAEANQQDIDTLCRIDAVCFNTNRPHPTERIKQLLIAANLKVFLIFYNKQPIGQVCLIFEKQQIRLTDLAILPHMQHKGFGQALLMYCLNYVEQYEPKKITLTVAANNQTALHLYQQVGFQIYNTVDYYKRPF